MLRRPDGASRAPDDGFVVPDEAHTANGRFKRTFGAYLWGAMILATVLHFVTFAFWPPMSAGDWSFSVAEIEAIELPPEVQIPDAPREIARPAQPVIGDVDIDPDVTIASTRIEDYRPDQLPAPKTESAERVNLAEQPTFTPYTVAPRLLNGAEVERALVREYPEALRQIGIGGRVIVHLFIDGEGTVQNALVHEGSGYPKLDHAALEVAFTMRFSPAYNRDRQVPVWIQQPITFRTR